MFLLVACNNQPQIIEEALYEQTEEEIANNDEETLTEEVFVEEANETSQEKALKFNVLYDIPKDWTQLTETEDGRVIIFHPCFEQNPSISIQYPNYEDGTFGLYIGIGQDAVITRIANVKDSDYEGITMVNEEGNEIFFEWIDKNTGTAFWNIPNVITAKFVDNKYEEDYDEEREECDDEM